MQCWHSNAPVHPCISQADPFGDLGCVISGSWKYNAITHPRRIKASSAAMPSWLLATSSIFSNVLSISEINQINYQLVSYHTLDARRFKICVEVYSGRIDFSSFARRVSKLSRMAGQVSRETSLAFLMHIHIIRFEICRVLFRFCSSYGVQNSEIPGKIYHTYELYFSRFVVHVDRQIVV